MHRRIETQIDGETRTCQRTFVEFNDHLVYFIEYGNRVGTKLALYGDVVGRETVTQGKSILLARHDFDFGDFTQVDRSVVAPADDQLVKLPGLELADKTHGVLATADVGETTGRIGSARHGCHDVIDLDAERGCPVRVECYVQFARLLTGQKHTRNAGDTCKTRLDFVFDEFLVAGKFPVWIARQHPNQQRCRARCLWTAAGADLRLNRIGRTRAVPVSGCL